MCAGETSHLERGIACKLEGRYDEAESALKAALGEDSGSAEAHYHLGLVYGFTGEFELSLAELECAAQIEPQSVPILLDLAMTHAMLGMNDEAKAGFLAVLAIDPGNDKARSNLSYME